MIQKHVFDAIHGRRSIGKLSLPIPNADELTKLFELAATAPDHKQLMPWRYVVLSGESLNRLGEVLLQAGIDKAKTQGQPLDDAKRKKLLTTTQRAPMIIACMTDYKTHPKVPEFEQLLSAGAAIQNLLIGLSAMGYQSIWRSGDLMNTPAVRGFFGLDKPSKASFENIMTGFIYVGSSNVVMPKRPPVDLTKMVAYGLDAINP